MANTDLLVVLDDIARKIVKDEDVADPSEKVFIWVIEKSGGTMLEGAWGLDQS